MDSGSVIEEYLRCPNHHTTSFKETFSLSGYDGVRTVMIECGNTEIAKRKFKGSDVIQDPFMIERWRDSVFADHTVVYLEGEVRKLRELLYGPGMEEVIIFV